MKNKGHPMTPAPTDLMPERIYVFSDAKSIGDLGFTRTDMKDNHVEYVRADLVPRQAVAVRELTEAETAEIESTKMDKKYDHLNAEMRQAVTGDAIYAPVNVKERKPTEKGWYLFTCSGLPSACGRAHFDGKSFGSFQKDGFPHSGEGLDLFWLEAHPAVPAEPTDRDAIMALNSLLNDALASRDGYGDSRKDAETIRRALSAPAREAKLVEALKYYAPLTYGGVARNALAAHDKESK